MGEKAKKQATPRSILVAWANEQENWARSVVGDVLLSREQLSEDAEQEVYEMLLAEKGLSSDPPVNVALLHAGAVVGAKADPLRLKSLSDLENVNALVGGQRIDFNDHLTLVYGENATGKTGYVRVLKRLAAVRSAERVLSDVQKPSSAPPKGEVSFSRENRSLNQVGHCLTWVVPCSN